MIVLAAIPPHETEYRLAGLINPLRQLFHWLDAAVVR